MRFLLMLLFIFPSLYAGDKTVYTADEPLLNECSLLTRLTSAVTMQELEEQVPLTQLFMAREAIPGRVQYILQHQDLTPFSTAELVVANKFLKIEKIDGYDQWYDENGCYVIGGLASIAFVPMAIGVSSAMAVAQYLGGAIGFLGASGTVKTAALSCLPVSGLGGLWFSSYYQPDQAAIDDAIERTEHEIEKRKA